MEELPDEQLAEGFRCLRDNLCFAELFRRYRREVFGVCVRVVRSAATAEDLTHDVFLTVFHKVDGFEAQNFRAWLLTIARNTAINHLHSWAARLANATAPLPEPANGSSPADSAILRDEVIEVLDQISPEQRVALKLKYEHGYSYDEIADLMHCGLNEVKSHLQNGRRRFRILWAERSIRQDKR